MTESRGEKSRHGEALQTMKKEKNLSRRKFLKTAAAAAGGLALAGCRTSTPTPLPTRPPSGVTPPVLPETPIYGDPERPLEDRVADLVYRMDASELASQMRTESPSVERLGIPKYNWWSEGGHGVARAGLATVFPQVIGLAATWNADLVRRTADVVSTEGRAKHHEAVRNGDDGLYTGLTFFSPNINIFRDPRWGRGQETYGEDPYLTARLAVNYVRGMQGDDPKYRKTAATAKHFAVHSGPEHDRWGFDAVVSAADLQMTYLPAFKALVAEAGVESVMSAYNRINGAACSADPWLLQKLLREEWGFDGYVVADCGAVGFLYYAHGLVASREDAAALAVSAGVDLECGCTYGLPCDFIYLTLAVLHHTVTEDDLRQAALRLFRTRFRLGMFDPPERVPYAQIPYAVVDSQPHREAALEAARQSLVLLKNEGGALPLDKSAVRRIAVIGPNADDTLVQAGNYFGTPQDPVSVLAGIRAAVPDAEVTYAAGCSITGGPEDGIAPAVALAKDAQAAVLVLGLSQRLEGEEDQVEGTRKGEPASQGDRTTLDLPAVQEKLLKAVAAAGVPVILVLFNGSALSVNWAEENVPAILEAWYPGQAGGTAVAEAIFGDVNPGGRLPLTFYRSVKDLPDIMDYAMENRTYRYFKGRPLYPFGYGLSYTTFAYRDLRIEPAEIRPGDSVVVRAEVENTGGRAGDEVVQLYVKDLAAAAPVPRIQLAGFRRIRLAPGEKQTVEFTLEGAQMSYADRDGNWILEPGDFRIWVGGGQPGWAVDGKPAAGVDGQFTVRGGSPAPLSPD
jgi:beta-glucosidase